MSKLYHQTDPPTAEIILATRQMKPGIGGLAGGGIYFATTPELTAHKAHKSGVILEATVQLGKILVLDKEGDPDMTLQKLKSMGYDSVCIQRAVSSGQEYVVYDPEQVLSIVRAPDSPSARLVDFARDLFGVKPSRGVEREGVPGRPSASEPTPQPPASPAKPTPQPTRQPPPKAHPAMAAPAPQPPPSQPPIAHLAMERRRWWGSRLIAPLIRWRAERALKNALNSGLTLKQLRAKGHVEGLKAAGITCTEEAARKGASGGNSMAPLGQPPASQAQLDTQQQLAEAIRQRQQGEGLVVVPWETISITKTTLAKGAFGTVALATLSELGGMQCAVKIADVRSGDGLEEALALLNEGSFMNINHPNIVKMFGITFGAPSKIGLIMELMTCSLHELIHAHALSGMRRYVTWADSLLAIATDIAFGMAFLHYHNLIHRDLKPLNVLMSGGWMAKVADFGEMKRIEGGGDAGARAAGSGRIHGTPSYVSPEAASVSIPSAPRVGTPTDVWSFGCLLAHCAARASPYTDIEYLGRALKPQEVVQWLLDGRANPLSMVVEGQNMPALLMGMARECTSVVPEQRPTFAQLAARLSAPSLIREICFKDAVIDEDEEDDLEARRPPVKLIVPTPEVLKEPSAARFREELSRGSSAKPEAEVHACVIS